MEMEKWFLPCLQITVKIFDHFLCGIVLEVVKMEGDNVWWERIRTTAQLDG